MINLYHKQAEGAATLVFTVLILIVSTLIIIFAADYGRIQTKVALNQIKNQQAFEAAEAGLEYGITYLQQNANTILANPINGYIPAYSNVNTVNVPLTNNSSFTISYSNPTVNNYNLIRISVSGNSADNTASRVISQLVNFGSMLASPPTTTLVTKGSLTMSGSSQLVNVFNTTTVQSASTVSIGGSADTILQSGVSSTAGNIQSDIQQNVSTLQNTSITDFFAGYFGVPSSTIKNSVAHYYSNSVSTNYSGTLNGMTGTSIWIDQTASTATLSGSTTIGSSTSPVILIVNGDLDMKGTLTIYGFVYVMGTTSTEILGNVTIHGAMVTTDNLTMTGSTQVIYDPTVLTNLQNLPSMRYYARVPGSWKDF